MATLTFNDFRLSDARLIRVEAKRLKSPEEVDTKGHTRSKMSGRCFFPEADKPQNYVRLFITLGLNGFSGEQESEGQSFSIETEFEYLFVSKKVGYVEPEHAETLGYWFTAQALPIQAEKIKRLAQEMGFNGVRPDLGIEIEAGEILAGGEPQVPRKKTKSRKAVEPKS